MKKDTKTKAVKSITESRVWDWVIDSEKQNGTYVKESFSDPDDFGDEFDDEVDELDFEHEGDLSANPEEEFENEDYNIMADARKGYDSDIDSFDFEADDQEPLVLENFQNYTKAVSTIARSWTNGKLTSEQAMESICEALSK